MEPRNSCLKHSASFDHLSGDMNKNEFALISTALFHDGVRIHDLYSLSEIGMNKICDLHSTIELDFKCHERTGHH